MWIIFVVIIMLYLYSQATKKWEKIKNDHSFFSNSLLKRIFLIGLNGVIKPSIVILTFIVNISLLLMVALGIWWSIVPTALVAKYSYRIIVAIYFTGFLVRTFLLWANPPKF